MANRGIRTDGFGNVILGDVITRVGGADVTTVEDLVSFVEAFQVGPITPALQCMWGWMDGPFARRVLCSSVGPVLRCVGMYGTLTQIKRAFQLKVGAMDSYDMDRPDSTTQTKPMNQLPHLKVGDQVPITVRRYNLHSKVASAPNYHASSWTEEALLVVPLLHEAKG